MPSPTVRWILRGGFSDLVSGGRLTLLFEDLPFDVSVMAAPIDSLRGREPIQLNLTLDRSYRLQIGSTPLAFRRDSRLGLRFLFPGNAFIGNFRVPSGQVGVQWDVEAEVVGGSTSRLGRFAMTPAADSRLILTWVVLLPPNETLSDSARRGWSAFLNPLSPSVLDVLSPSTVLRMAWSGNLRLNVRAHWGSSWSWLLPGHVPVVDTDKSIGADLGLWADLELRRQGRFALVLSSRRGRVRASIQRESSRSRRLAAGAALGGSTQVRVRRLSPDFSEPLGTITNALDASARQWIHQKLPDALNRRYEIALGLEASDLRHFKTLLRAEWAIGEDPARVEEYRFLLSGQVPAPRSGLTLSGAIERLRRKEQSIEFRLFDWIRLGRSSEKEIRHTTDLTPDGQFVVSRQKGVRHKSWAWQEIQFFSLFESQAEGGPVVFDWSIGLEGRFSRDELRRWLRVLLRLQLVPEIRLPAAHHSPLRVSCLAVSRLQPEIVDRLSSTSARQARELLVRALEIAHPDRYRLGSFRRDWMDRPDVAQLVENDPVQAHLASRYPVTSRTLAERQAVVHEYRQVLSFLRWLQSWRAHGESSLVDLAGGSWHLPLFEFVHLLMPASKRKGAVMVSGDLEWEAGELTLLESAVR